MTNNTKLVRSSYKPTELQATERVTITPAQKRFIEKKYRCRAGVKIRSMINDMMIIAAAEGVKDDE